MSERNEASARPLQHGDILLGYVGGGCCGGPGGIGPEIAVDGPALSLRSAAHLLALTRPSLLTPSSYTVQIAVGCLRHVKSSLRCHSLALRAVSSVRGGGDSYRPINPVGHVIFAPSFDPSSVLIRSPRWSRLLGPDH